MDDKLKYAAAPVMLVFAIVILALYPANYTTLMGAEGFAGFLFGTFIIKVLFALGLYLSAYGYGGLVYGRIIKSKGGLFEETLFKAALGFVMISTSMFLVGVVGLLYPFVGFAVLIGGIAAGGKGLVSLYRSVSGMDRSVEVDFVFVLCLGLSLYFLIPGLYRSFLPPTGFDILMYHYGVPRMYIDAHHIFATPDVNGSSFPFGMEMLYMLMMLVDDFISANILNYSFVLFGGLGAVLFAREYTPKRVGLIAFAIYVSIPLVGWLMPQAYIELGQAAFTMFGLYALVKGLDTDDRGWLVMAALMAGFTFSIKYTGAVFICFATATVLLYGLTVGKHGFKSSAKGAAIFLGVSLAVTAPWLIKNVVHYGNPVFPFLPSIFGVKVSAGSGMISGPGGPGGEGSRLWKLVSSVWATTLSSADYRYREGSNLGPLLLMLVPGLVFFRGGSRQVRLLAAFTVIFFLVVSLGGGLRYFAPILPALAIMAAYPVGALLSDGSKPLKAAGGVLVVILCFGALLASTQRSAVEGFPSTGPGNVDRYYSSNMGGYLASYDVWKWVDKNLPKDAVVYQLWDDASVYFRHRKTLGFPLGWGDTGRQKIHYIRGENGFAGYLPGEEIIANLKKMGATYLLVNANREGHSLPQDEYFAANAELLYNYRNVFLFRLK